MLGEEKDKNWCNYERSMEWVCSTPVGILPLLLVYRCHTGSNLEKSLNKNALRNEIAGR